jgi:hypothetical protein
MYICISFLIELRFLDIKLSKENPKQEHGDTGFMLSKRGQCFKLHACQYLFKVYVLYYIINTKGFTESIGQKYAIKSNPKRE